MWWQPAEDNPEQLSITQLEFRRAGLRRIPRIALIQMNVPDKSRSDMRDAARWGRVLAFEDEVRAAARTGEFRNGQELIHALSACAGPELTKAERQAEKVEALTAKVLAAEMDRKDEEIAGLRGRVRELEEQLQAAVGALEAGDTKPAEALLQVEERAQAAQIEAVGEDEGARRRESAALAREQGAMAMGRDVRAALTAYERAAEYEPEDRWTHILIGDLWVLLGDLGTAMFSPSA